MVLSVRCPNTGNDNNASSGDASYNYGLKILQMNDTSEQVEIQVIALNTAKGHTCQGGKNHLCAGK